MPGGAPSTTPSTTRVESSRVESSQAESSVGQSVRSPPRARRRRRAPAAPSLDDLMPSLLEHAAQCEIAMEGLRRTAVDAGPLHESRWGEEARSCEWQWPPGTPSYADGVIELTLMHLVELWALGLFGSARLHDELCRLSADL